MQDTSSLYYSNYCVAMAMATSPAPHVLVLAFPQQGHINPLIHISKYLASRGILITFVLSQHDHSRMLRANQKAPSGMIHLSPNLRLVSVPDGLPLQHADDSDIYNYMFTDHIHAMAQMRDGVEDLIPTLQHPLSLILADVFVAWTSQVAHKFGIPMAAFFTSNAISCSIFYHARSLKSSGILPFSDKDGNFIAPDNVITTIPGVPPVLPRDFPACLTFPESHIRFEFILSLYDNMHSASAIFINTFEELELESCAISALREINVGVVPIGPLLLLSGEGISHNAKLESSYWPEQDDCLEWLTSESPSSVLYVSFGSVAAISPEQIKELAMGLEESQQPFLWVIRPDTVVGSLEKMLPDGFLDRTKERGLIISWAPQLAVLAHHAVGAFLTHCGWNSLVENLSSGGVPVLCWPFVAEQRLNCRILVDHWKIGMEFRKRPDSDIVGKEEIARVVKAMMEEEEGREMRTRAARFKDRAKMAAEIGGSSQLNMETFIESLRM